MKKKNSDRKRRGQGKKLTSKSSISESQKKKKGSSSGDTVGSRDVSVSQQSSWSRFFRMFSCTSNAKEQIVENANLSRNAPEVPPTKPKPVDEVPTSPTPVVEPKISLSEKKQSNLSGAIGVPPQIPQSDWNIKDEQKESFPIIDDEDTNSVAASELTMDTFFRNQENSSHNSKDRSWSAFLGFGISTQNQQSTQSPPISPMNHQQNNNSTRSAGNENLTRSSSFFGFGGYGSSNQPSNSNNNLNNSNRAGLDPSSMGIGSNSGDDDPRGAGDATPGVKPTRLQQQQASLLQRTQRSMRNSSGNNTPLVDPLARPGSFRAMRASSLMGTPQHSSTPASPGSAPSTPLQPINLMMVSTGDSDALCDIYPSQEDQMFEEMKHGVHSSGGGMGGMGSGKKSAKKEENAVFTGQNPAMKQMRNRQMLATTHRSHSTMSSSMGSPTNVSSVASDFYISSSTDDEYGGRSGNNSISPKSPSASRTAASTFTHPAPYYRSQSAPIQPLQQASSSQNNNSVYKDSPSVSKSSAYNAEQYASSPGKSEIDMQNPMNLKKAYAAKAAQMARSGTAAGAAASAAALAGANSDNRPGAVKVASSDETDIEYAIMLSLQEEQKRKQLEEAERKAIEEAVQRSTINTRPSIRLLQSKYYNSR